MSFRQDPVRNGAAYMDFGDGTETRVHPMTCLCGCNLDVTVDPWTCPECGWQQGVDPRGTRSMLDIKGIKERLEKATAGEWTATLVRCHKPEGCDIAHPEICSRCRPCGVWADEKAIGETGFRSSKGICFPGCFTQELEPEDALNFTFIANAPTDIKALLEEVERLRKALEDMYDIGIYIENGFLMCNKQKMMKVTSPLREDATWRNAVLWLQERDALSGETDGAA